MSERTFRIRFGREDLILETGELARQASGSVMVSYGGTEVLVSACISKEVKEGIDFFPLTVEYREKTYAAGRIPGGFFKREGRPSENEILISRLIDRPIRPLFPKGLLNEVQVMAIVLSSDAENDPDILAIIGASAALSISEIPFYGPVAACRVGRIDGEFILNPTYAQLEKSDLDVVVTSTKKGIIMLEAKTKEVNEAVFIEAIRFAEDNLKKLIIFQEEFAQAFRKPKTQIEYKKIDPVLLEKVREFSRQRLDNIYKISTKEEREEVIDLLCRDLRDKFVPEGFAESDIKAALLDIEKVQVRRYILDKGVRIDGRSPTDIREITCRVGLLARTHGSSLFTRGQTQSLSITTLGTGEDQQLIEALEGETHKSFMLHYSFPPFSVGETAPLRGPGRREIGHGALAEKALLSVMPEKEKFPYTIRVVSEILESNGSSSMATVCAASLSLMDAGVPIKRPVAGIALGLIKEDERSIVLTDITGLEDHFGDMDFKVAGTREGIVAVQLDLKIEGISMDLLKDCLFQARDARFCVLDKMEDVLKEPRKELSSYAPRIEILKINSEKIGGLIGPGGKTIRKIISSTGVVSIDVEEDGSVLVASNDPASSQKAIDMIKDITEEVEAGKVYIGKIKRLMPFGAFCEIAAGKEGLIHISELSDHFVKDPQEVVKVGQEVKVRVVNVDEQGRINLSMKRVEKRDEKRNGSISA
jgi:polyribonucleotide nucleotidyltransferase